MSRSYSRWMFPLMLCAVLANIGVAQNDVETNKSDGVIHQSIAMLRAQALKALLSGDNSSAIEAADAIMEQNPDDARSMRLAADVYLRTGKCERAAELFDRYITMEPSQLPGLWQRGIAHFFAGNFKRGAEQFESHRRVNPNDVENAAWHFLCIAKADSPQRAKEIVLPAPNDPRIPMDEVLQMLRSGDTSIVRARVESLPEGSPLRENAEFFADLYLGLYADANGQSEEAMRRMDQAAKNAPHHYMGDVARVYAQHLKKK